MNARERFLKIARFELKDELFIPSFFQWFWGEAVHNWVEKEGAPRQILDLECCHEYFGVERVEILPVNMSIQALGWGIDPPYVPPYSPLFERRVIQEEKTYNLVIDEAGRRCKVSKEHPERMPQWLEFPVKNRDDWERLKEERLDPHDQARFPAWWEDRVKCWKNRDYPIGLGVGSFFGFMRSFLGLENLCRMYYEDPDLVHDMGNWLEHFEDEMIKKVLKDVRPDFVSYWEDMAYKSGSMISPNTFREFMMPHYKKLNKLLRDNGIDIILVDSDGDTRELIPLWIESGLSGHYPLEVTASMDAVELRKEYGETFVLIGNIDKRTLSTDKRAIKEELEKKIPFLLSKGGYFPALDHFVPPEVSFENYKYYLQLLKQIAGTNK